MIRNLFGGSKCRTVDVCDIFGDNSGKALYRLDGNANDESGNYHGTETAITYGGGVYERGAVFNGTSSVILTNILTVPSSPYTVSTWINPTVLGTSLGIIGDTPTTSEKGFFLLKLTTNKVRFLIAGGDGVVTYYADTVSSVPSGSFTNITATWDGTTNVNGIKIYFNGVLEGQGTSGVSATTIGAWTRQIYIGNLVNQTYWNGSIDQVRIFNRAITATEVATLYAECAPTSIVDNINPFEDGSLKALYQFNGDATDKTGVYNGTATNVTYGTGKFGQCAVFNGSSSWIDIGKPANSSTEMSVSFYFYQSTVLASTLIFDSSSNGDVQGISIQTGDIAGRIKINVFSDINYAYSMPTPISSATWHYITMTFKAGVGAKLYINGTFIGMVVITNTTPLTHTNNINVGRRANGTGYLTGYIDQTRIFNKALTPIEVASLYNETTPLEEPMHSLVDPFKDGSGKALYRLDGNALDESGNYNGTATSVTYGAGRFGRAGVFNGTNSSNINLGTPTIFDPDTTGALSFSCWVNVTTLGAYNAIVSSVNSTDPGDASTMAYYIWIRNTNIIELMHSDGTITPSVTISSIAVTAGWHHIVGVISVGGTNKIYLDGNLVGSNTAKSSTKAIYPVFLGKYGSTFAFRGSIDQARIFNRALTASEVQTLYTEI